MTPGLGVFWIRLVHVFCFQAVECQGPCKPLLGGGFKSVFFLMFIPNFGEMIQFDEHMFQMGWFNHQLDEFKGFFCWKRLISSF